jgi:hypothetical protein
MQCHDPQHPLHSVFLAGVLRGKEGGKAPAMIVGLLALGKQGKALLARRAFCQGFGKGCRMAPDTLRAETERVLHYFNRGSLPLGKVAAENKGGDATDLQRMGVPVKAREPAPPRLDESFPLSVPPLLTRKEQKARNRQQEAKRLSRLYRPEPCPARQYGTRPIVLSVVGGYNTAKG